jgi:four helix bundle protein
MHNEKTSAPHDINERALDFAHSVVLLYDKLDKRSNSARVLGNQLLRSATSIGANLAEARAGQTKADFIAKSSIALKEAHETLWWLRLMSRSGVLDTERAAPLVSETRELIAILTTILKRAKASKTRGIDGTA